MSFASTGAMLDFPYLEIPRRDFVGRLNLPPESARSAERLFIQGKPEAFALLDELPRQGLAIVGTRTPQPRATTLVRRWVQAWSHSDRIILSGLAIGVDTAAHEAALESGLPTIAILATGLRQIYPRQNAALAARIADLPVWQRRNGWHIVRDGVKYVLRHPVTLEEVYSGSLKRCRDVADESLPD
jgi:hypothetical protein